MNSNDLREKLIIPAVVGALYAALTMLLAPISYGNLQFRISEALCVLPVFFPYTSVGLFLGCALANMISAAGILDVVFGSLATLCAGLCAAACGREARRTGAMPSAAMRGSGVPEPRGLERRRHRRGARVELRARRLLAELPALRRGGRAR